MARKLLTYLDAKERKTQHKTPCCDCPFSRESLPGWLGELSAAEWMQIAHGEGASECHTLKSPSDEPWMCAGLAIYRANVAKRLRSPTAFRLPANRVLVFASPMEFYEHHKQDLMTWRKKKNTSG